MPQQAAFYLLVGALGTVLHWCVLAALLYAAMAGPLLASTCGAVCGALLNYRLSYRHVFRSSAAHAVALPRFLAVAVLGIATNALVLMLAVPLLPLVVAQALASGTVLAGGFILNRRWSFRA